jgi:hypothetical protein
MVFDFLIDGQQLAQARSPLLPIRSEIRFKLRAKCVEDLKALRDPRWLIRYKESPRH